MVNEEEKLEGQAGPCVERAVQRLSLGCLEGKTLRGELVDGFTAPACSCPYLAGLCCVSH